MRLSEVLRQYRWASQKQGKVLAAEIGIGSSILSRIEHGHVPDGRHLTQILTWLLEEKADE